MDSGVGPGPPQTKKIVITGQLSKEALANFCRGNTERAQVAVEKGRTGERVLETMSSKKRTLKMSASKTSQPQRTEKESIFNGDCMEVKAIEGKSMLSEARKGDNRNHQCPKNWEWISVVRGP